MKKYLLILVGTPLIIMIVLATTEQWASSRTNIEPSAVDWPSGGSQIGRKQSTTGTGTTGPPPTPIPGPIFLPLIYKRFAEYSPPTPIPPPGSTPTPTPTPPATGQFAYVSDVAADPDTNQIFVASPRHDSVYVINGATDSVTRQVPVGNGPTGLTVLDDIPAQPNKVFVAHQYGSNSWRPGVKGFGVNDSTSNDTENNGYVGSGPVKIAANPANGRVYVSNLFDKLAVLNGDSTSPETLLGVVDQKAFQAAYGIDVSSVTDLVYLATRDSGELIVFDGAINPLDTPPDQLLQPGFIPLHVKPPEPCTLWSVVVNEATGHVFVPCPQLSKVYVLDELSVSFSSLEESGVLEEREGGLALVISPTAASWVATITVPNGTNLGQEGIAVDSNTGYVYITNATNDTLVILQDNQNPASIVYDSTVTVGAKPQGVDVNSSTNKVYVGNTDDNTVTVLSGGPTFGTITTIPLTP